LSNIVLLKQLLFNRARGSVTETQSHLEYGRKVNYLAERIAEALDKRLYKLYNDINKIIVTLRTTN